MSEAIFMLNAIKNYAANLEAKLANDLNALAAEPPPKAEGTVTIPKRRGRPPKRKV